MADYRETFPDYDPATLPAIPASWTDRSWCNEPCPAFMVGESSGAIVFVDYADAERREFGQTERFSIHPLDLEGCLMVDAIPFASNDWEAVLQHVAATYPHGEA